MLTLVWRMSCSTDRYANGSATRYGGRCVARPRILIVCFACASLPLRFVVSALEGDSLFSTLVHTALGILPGLTALRLCLLSIPCARPCLSLSAQIGVYGCAAQQLPLDDSYD